MITHYLDPLLRRDEDKEDTNTPTTEEEDESRWKTYGIVIAILLLLFGIAAFFLWRRYVRPYWIKGKEQMARVEEGVRDVKEGAEKVRTAGGKATEAMKSGKVLVEKAKNAADRRHMN